MGLFGNFFDLDGDGKADMFEELLGLEALGFFDTGDDSDGEDEEYDFDDDTDNDDD